jgi:hypothetical protein
MLFRLLADLAVILGQFGVMRNLDAVLQKVYV